MLQVWSSIEDVAGPQLRTKIGVIEVNVMYIKVLKKKKKKSLVTTTQ